MAFCPSRQVLSYFVLPEKREVYIFVLSGVTSFRPMTILISYIAVSSLTILGSKISIKTSHHKIVNAMSRPQLYLVLCSLLPILWYILFFSFVFRSWYKIGHVPRPYFPDPKNLDFDLHYAAIVISTIFVGLSPIFLIHSGLRWTNSRLQNISLLILSLNYFIWWIVLIIDPWQFREWFID